MRGAIVRLATRFAPTAYHFWYYHNAVWDRTSWMGINTQKVSSDMWNYQEILFSLRPSLLIEFGTCRGGSALFFASVTRQIGSSFKVVSVDIDHSQTSELTKSDSDIELLTMSSTDDRVNHVCWKCGSSAPALHSVSLTVTTRKTTFWPR